MIDCKKASLLVDKKKGVKLSFFKIIELKFHLLICKYCNNYKKDSKVMDDLMSNITKNITNQLTDQEKELMNININK